MSIQPGNMTRSGIQYSQDSRKPMQRSNAGTFEANLQRTSGDPSAREDADRKTTGVLKQLGNQGWGGRKKGSSRKRGRSRKGRRSSKRMRSRKQRISRR